MIPASRQPRAPCNARVKTLVLHIGTPKTGTTSIQKFFFDHAIRLREIGVDYPTNTEFLWGWGHHPLGAVLSTPYPRWVDTSFDLPAPLVYQALCRAVEDSPCDRIVVSTEQLSLADRLHELPDLLSGINIRVVCYLRWQVNYLESWWRQSVMTGGGYSQLTRDGFEEFAARWLPTLDHLQRGKQLEELFGRENLDLRIYDRSCLKNGDIVDDFAEVVGLSGEDLDDLRRGNETVLENSGVGGALLELKASMNRWVFWDRDIRYLRRFSKDLEAHWRAMEWKGAHSRALLEAFPVSRRLEIHSEFERSNREFIARYAPERALPPSPPESELAAPTIETEPELANVAELFVRLWQEQDARIRELEALVNGSEPVAEE